MNYAIILAGGIGSRFWPFSREFEPKQFMKVIKDESLIQATIRRLENVINPENTYIITNSVYFYELKKQIKEFCIPSKNIILEPEGKNTAPAIGLCARLISQHDKDAVLVVLPSDHYIKNLDKFKCSLRKSMTCAQQNFLVTIGIKPRKPSTGYGYIKVKSEQKKLDFAEATTVAGKTANYYVVERFLEKPNFSKAKEYIKDKNFFWNSGIFIWKASLFLLELRLYLPGLYSQIMSIKTKGDIEHIWPKIKPVSVDSGIMEYSKRIVLIPSNFYWSDLGSWDALNEILPKDIKGNIIQADSLDLKSRRICVFSRSNRLISTVGIKDLIIADTPDALLVCDRNKTQEVKKIVGRLKLSNRKEHLRHITEKRPWGSYTVLERGIGYKIKIIEIEPKKRLSLQMHKKRAEHWIVVSGCAKVTGSGGLRLIRKNQSIYIAKGDKHRLENPTNHPIKIVEVQTGNYLEEDDIKRFDDDFKR